MPHPPHRPPTPSASAASAALRGGDWAITLREPVAFDPAGAWFDAEVRERRGPGGDARVHLLDDGALASAAVIEQLRGACAHHVWLQHHDLVPVRAILQHDGRVAVVSDPWPSVRLAQLVGEVPVPPRAAGELAALVAAGLHALYTASAPGSIRPAGLLHGGLDLHTLLVGRDGRVGMLEAGLAPALRARGAAATDPAFLAPEARGDAPAASPADVYAASMLLVACLGGRPPEPLPAVADEHARGVVATLAAVFDLDGPLAELLRLGLSFDPALRPSARELSGRIREALPRMGGRWLTAWAGDVIPESGPTRPLPSVDGEEETGELPPSQRASSGPIPESLRPLRRAGGEGGERPVDARRVLGTVAGALGAAALLALASWLAVPVVTRWWLDNHGEMDLEEVPTELDGPPEPEAGVVVVSEDDLARGPGAAPPDASVTGRPVAVVVVPGSDDPEAPDEPSPFALATPDGPPPPRDDAPEPEPVARPIRVVPTPVIPAPVDIDTPAWGTRWEKVPASTPLVQLHVEVPLAGQISVVCANGVTAHGEAFVDLQPPRGRCDVRANGPGGVTEGSFQATRSGAYTCRVEFLDQLRCR